MPLVLALLKKMLSQINSSYQPWLSLIQRAHLEQVTYLSRNKLNIQLSILHSKIINLQYCILASKCLLYNDSVSNMINGYCSIWLNISIRLGNWQTVERINYRRQLEEMYGLQLIFLFFCGMFVIWSPFGCHQDKCLQIGTLFKLVFKRLSPKRVRTFSGYPEGISPISQLSC